MDTTKERALALARALRKKSDPIDEPPSGLLGTVPRDPKYHYGSILPFRKPKAGGPAEWSPMYSELVKGLTDAFTAPGRAYAGTMPADAMPFEAMNLAGNLQLASAGGLLGQGRLAAQPGTLGLTAYHGSPHKFDKFSMEKIGTGEGAQAYGHGLYFAENPAVAKDYAKNITPSGPIPPARRTFKGNELEAGTWEYKAASLVDEIGLPGARKTVEGWITNSKPTDDIAGFRTVLNTLNSAASKSEFKRLAGGNLYKVDIPDAQVAKMLDWDKPLSQQPEGVKSALRKLGVDPTKYGMLGEAAYGPNDPARVVYGQIAHKLGGSDKASEAFRNLGIPGIRYLDQGSRGASGTGKWRITYKDGKSEIFDFRPNDSVLQQMGAKAEPHGTSNFVVFDETLPKILERK